MPLHGIYYRSTRLRPTKPKRYKPFRRGARVVHKRQIAKGPEHFGIVIRSNPYVTHVRYEGMLQYIYGPVPLPTGDLEPAPALPAPGRTDWLIRPRVRKGGRIVVKAYKAPVPHTRYTD